MVSGLVDKSHDSIVISSLVCLASVFRVRIQLVCLVLAGSAVSPYFGTDLTTHLPAYLSRTLTQTQLATPTNSTGEHD
jgi:hypothetical protein